MCMVELNKDTVYKRLGKANPSNIVFNEVFHQQGIPIPDQEELQNGQFLRPAEIAQISQG